MPLGPNYNYDLENQRIQQQQQIINAMQAGALKPMEVPTAGAGQVQAKVNPLAAIMPAIQEALLNKARSGIQAKQDDLAGRYKQDLVDGMNNFYQKSAGGWDHDQTPASSDTDITMANPTDSWNYRAPDMKGAIVDAMSSNNPVVQQVGQAGLQQMYRNDPMSQLLGTGMSQAGPTPPQAVLDSGGYTINGQAPGPQAVGTPTPTAPLSAAPQSPTPGMAARPMPGPGSSIDQRLAYYFPMIPPEQARALYAADPTGKTLAEENAHRGRMITAGDNIFQPTGPGAVQLPVGAVDARTTVKQADASVADQHELVNGTDPNTGAPFTRTKAQAIGLTGQGSGVDLLQQLKPEDREKVLMEAATSGQKQFSIDFMGVNGQRVKGTVDLGGGQGGYQSGQSPALGAEQKARGDALAAQRTSIDEDAGTAMSIKARISEMRDASQNFQTGATAPLKEKLGSIAIAMGQDPQAVNARLGNISDMQAFNKEATQMAFDMVKQLGSREAAAVVNQAVKSSAQMGNQPGANKAIMDVMEGMADWKIAKQEQAQAWADSHHGSIEGFQTFFNKTNPITKYVHEVKATSPMPMGGAGGPPGPGNAVNQQSAPQAVPRGVTPIPLDEYLKKYGVH